jgi:hypothetical protein
LHSERKGLDRAWLKWLNRAVLVIAASLCLWFLLTHRQDLVAIWTRADLTLLGAATVVFIVFVFVQVRVSVLVLQTLGGRVPTMAASRIVLLSLMGKYVPGKIWVVTLRASFLGRYGVPPTMAVASVVTEHVFLFATGAAWFAAAIFVDSTRIGIWAITAALLTLTVLVVAPGASLRRVTGIMKRIGLSTLTPELTPRRALTITVTYLTSWLALGVGIWLLASGLDLGLPPIAVVGLAGHYGIAVIGGLLAFFAPAGVGIREGLFTAAMSNHLSAADAMFLALAARLCIALAELLATAIAVVWRVREP